MVILQNANNFSNIDLPYLLFYKLFYRYIKDYNKNLNYLFYDMKLGYSYLLNIKQYNIKEYMPILSSFMNMIVKNKNVSKEFKEFLFIKIIY